MAWKFIEDIMKNVGKLWSNEIPIFLNNERKLKFNMSKNESVIYLSL